MPWEEMNQVLSAVKGLGIMSGNALTLKVEPFQPFTRPAEVKDASPMHNKAKRFQGIIDDSFHLRGGTILNYRIPLDGPIDIGDQALWHGVYTYSAALEYHLHSSEEKRLKLAGYVEGLADQQPGGMLIRGIDDSGRMEYDASNDSACGHVLGLFGAFRYGDHTNDMRLAELMHQWAQSIIHHDYSLINPDGKPTKYGALDQGWKSDPLRMTLLLAILLVAFQITRSPEYRKRYDELKYRYYLMLAFPKARFLWIEKYPDTHRAAIQLHILAELDPHESVYRHGLTRLMDLARKQGNVWVLALGGRHIGYGPGDLELARKVMYEFTVEDKSQNIGRRLSETWKGEKAQWPPKKVLWKEFDTKWVALQPIPKWQKWSQDFEWQRSPYDLDSRLGNGEGPDSLLNGGDFLVAWRLGQLTGLFRESD